jgi:excisionase family DNA binding protein
MVEKKKAPKKETKPKAAKKAEPKIAKEPVAKAVAETAPPAAATGEELVSMEEVATLLKMPLVQVRKMVQTGRIPGVKMDGEWRFNKDLVYQAIHRRSRGW